MAKVKSPLFSMAASGQLGKSLVYMTWKGIDDVRQHVIPANPKSAGQVAQRGHLTAAVALYHSTPFNAADKAAFEVWASQSSSPRSGFNRFVEEVVNALKAGHTFNPISAIVISGIGANTFHVAANGKTGDTYVGKIGLTPSTMNNSFTVTNTAGALTADPAGLSASTPYYFYIEDTTASEDARTGIVRQVTSA